MSTRRFGFRQKSRASDALYQMRPLFGAVPTSIRDVVEWETGPIRNQGSEGACVGFGCKALLEAAPFKQTGEPTAREIYLQARIIDEFDDDEVQEGTSVRAGLDVLRSLGLIRNYVWASNVEDVYQFLDKKGPVVAGVSWHGYFTDLDGRMRFDGPEVGGHSITFTGYDRTTRRFKFQNSWGTEFGARGFGYVTEADLSRELTKRYGVCAGIVEAIAA